MLNSESRSKSKNNFFAFETPVDGYPIGPVQAKKMAATWRRFGFREAEPVDALSTAWEIDQRSPGLDQSRILAICYRLGQQAMRHNAAPVVFLDKELREGEQQIQIAAPEEEIIEQWRLAGDTSIDHLRALLIEKLNITDRRARQIFDGLVAQVEKGDDDLFGRESICKAVHEGIISRRQRHKSPVPTGQKINSRFLFGDDAGGAA